MSGISKLISDAVYIKAKEALIEVSRSGDVSRKLQAIKSCKEHGISKVADVFGVSRLTITTWIKSFSKSGLDGLRLRAGRGRKSILDTGESLQVKSWIAQEPNITIKKIRIKIEERFGKTISFGALHNLIKKLKLSYITPRPRHYKKKESTGEEFKKKSSKQAKSKPK